MTIKLDWTDPNPLESGYKVYRSTSPMSVGALPAPLATLGANATTYTDLSVVDGTTYYYRIGAFDGTNPEQVSAEVSLKAQQTLTLTFPASATSRYTYSTVIGGTTFSYTAGVSDTITAVRTALATQIDATAQYAATAAGSVVQVTGTGITTGTQAVTETAPEADQRAFFWYDPATNTSVFADKLNTYSNFGDGASKTGPLVRFSPEDNWLASIAKDDLGGTTLTWYKGQTSSEARLLLSPQPANISGYFSSGSLLDFPAAAAWDSDANNLLLMSYNAAGDVVKERRFSASGSVTSTTTVTVDGVSTYQFYPWMIVKFLGQWRAFTDSYGRAYYFKRNASSADWTQYTHDQWNLPIFPSYGRYTVGADTLSGGTVLTALVDHVNPNAPGAQPHYIVIMRTTDGETWTQVGTSRNLNTADGLTSSFGEVGHVVTSGSTYGSRLQRIGTSLGYYWATSATGNSDTGVYVLKSNADGTTWTTSKCTVDGAAFTGQFSHICSNNDGSAVLATRVVNAGSSNCACYLMKSTDGINFTTLPDSAVFASGYGSGSTDYKPVPNSVIGDLRTTVLSSGTKFLFERLLSKN